MPRGVFHFEKGCEILHCQILTSTADLPYEDWLDYRKRGIGGSDASVVCGINRYKSPVELWMEKTNQLPYQEAGEAAYWGTQLEGIVRAEFTKRTGIEVNIVKQLLQSTENPFMLANLDGMCRHPDYGDCIFEAKTATAYKTGEWDDAIPDEYMDPGSALYGGYGLPRRLYRCPDRRELVQMEAGGAGRRADLHVDLI